MMKNYSIFALAAFLLAGCETIPYADRVAAFEAKINADFVGKSIDSLILAMGPPQSTYPLTDGREIAQYSFENSETRGGGSYMDYETITVGYSTYTRKDGTTKQIPITKQIPYWRTEPVYTVYQKCVKRFVITQDKKVEAFKWEGNSCF